MTKPTFYRLEGDQPSVEFLAERIKANKTDVLSAVSVVIPNGQARVDIGLALTQVSSQIGLSYMTLQNLADDFALEVLIETGKIPANNLTIQAAINSLNSTNPDCLKRFYSIGELDKGELLPNTELALIEAFQQLSWVPVTSVPQKFPEKFREFFKLLKSELNENGFVTIPEVYELAIKNLKRDTKLLHYQLERTGAIILYLPSPLRDVEVSFVNELSEHIPVEIITHSALVEEIENADIKDLLDLSYLNLEPIAPTIKVSTSPKITYRKFDDPSIEVKSVVSEAYEKLQDCAPSQLAILFTTPEPYRYMLHNELEVADIPFVGTTLRTLDQSTAGKALLALLDIAQNGFSTKQVIDILESHPKLANQYGWKTDLRRVKIPDYASNWKPQLDRDGGILDIFEPIFDKLQELKKKPKTNKNWQQHVSTLNQLLTDCVEVTVPHQVEAFSKTLGIISNLESLDKLRSCPADLPTLHKFLKNALSTQNFWRKSRAGRGILVGNISATTYLKAEYLWVLGLTEGFFPKISTREKIITSSEWEELNFPQNTKQWVTALSLQSLNAAKLVASKEVFLSYPLADTKDASELSGEPTRWIPSAELCETPPAPVTPQSLNTSNDADEPLTTIDTHIYDNAIKMLKEREGEEFTQFDGLVANFQFSKSISPTQLENYVRCPQAYFFRNVLDLEMDQLSENYGIPSAMLKGSIYHKILEKFNEIKEPHLEKIDELKKIAIEVCARRFYLNGWDEFGLLQKEFINTLIKNLSELTAYMESRPEKWKIFGSEMELELPLEILGNTYEVTMKIDLIEHTAADDSTDLYQALDYKAGKNDGYKKLDRTGASFMGGRYLQYIFYGLALENQYPQTQIKSGYVFLNGDPFSASKNPLAITHRKDSNIAEKREGLLGEILSSLSAGIFPHGIYDSLDKSGSPMGTHKCGWCDPYNYSVNIKRLETESRDLLLKKRHRNKNGEHKKLPIKEYMFPFSTNPKNSQKNYNESKN